RELRPRQIRLEELVGRDEAAAGVAVEQVMAAGEPEIPHESLMGGAPARSARACGLYCSAPVPCPTIDQCFRSSIARSRRHNRPGTGHDEDTARTIDSCTRGRARAVLRRPWRARAVLSGEAHPSGGAVRG